MDLAYSILFLINAIGIQVIMRRFHVPHALIRYVTYLMAAVYIANPPITDSPYHLMGESSRYFGPNTLAYNMLLLLTIMAFITLLLIIADIMADLITVKDAFRPRRYIMYGTKRFLCRLGDIFVGSFLVLVCGYGLLSLFHYVSAEEIGKSLKEIWIIAYQNFFFLPGILVVYLFVMCACYILAYIIRNLGNVFNLFGAH